MDEAAAEAFDDTSACQPGGASTCTMLSHLGQERIWPMAVALRTFSFAWHVVQVMLKGSTTLSGRSSECDDLLLQSGRGNLETTPALVVRGESGKFFPQRGKSPRDKPPQA
jgi:hypothetical protein